MPRTFTRKIIAYFTNRVTLRAMSQLFLFVLKPMFQRIILCINNNRSINENDKIKRVVCIKMLSKNHDGNAY